MTFIIIGSTAAAKKFDDFREPKDFDVFMDEEGEVEAKRYYNSPIEPFWDDRLYDYFSSGDVRLATVDELYTIKVSHSFWELKNGSWSKHMTDILFFQEQGAKIIEELYSLLYKIWEDKHGKKKMNLAQSAGMFFTDAVERIYDHDSIHRSVAYLPGQPLYELILKENETVDIDPVKLWSLPHDDRVRLFREEIYATALERIAIPAIERGASFSPGWAYHWALRRTITSLLKGRSARFLVENFGEFKSVNDKFGELYTNRFLRNKERWLEKL